MAPADFFLFPKIKTSLKGTCFGTIEAIQRAATRGLNEVEAFQDSYRPAIAILPRDIQPAARLPAVACPLATPAVVPATLSSFVSRIKTSTDGGVSAMEPTGEEGFSGAAPLQFQRVILLAHPRLLSEAKSILSDGKTYCGPDITNHLLRLPQDSVYPGYNWELDCTGKYFYCAT
ncbi:hypothetical protein AAG570_004050 [Ranatra chinensis]|uniref:Uncharacterized protein n=1 Tax=Ranatra chinensis TaxID=642074 RepID=A0ABD0Y3Z5_9HEMI